MRACEMRGCGEWAQYRLRQRVFRPSYDLVPDEEQSRKEKRPCFKKVAINVPDWKLVAVLCNAHKGERFGIAPGVETSVEFVGCVPMTRCAG